MQTLENCLPKLILALEVVVGEEECSFVVKYHGKSDQSAVSSELLRE